MSIPAGQEPVSRRNERIREEGRWVKKGKEDVERGGERNEGKKVKDLLIEVEVKK